MVAPYKTGTFAPTCEGGGFYPNPSLELAVAKSGKSTPTGQSEMPTPVHRNCNFQRFGDVLCSLMPVLRKYDVVLYIEDVDPIETHALSVIGSATR